MSSTFLHEEKNIPPDELAERDAPACKNCGQQMYLTRVETQISDGGTRSKRTYECTRCGAKQSVQTESDRITPMTAGTAGTS
jgi:DNA-directed RNA polymerase subunit M/transcription elongation factor TFIIS